MKKNTTTIIVLSICTLVIMFTPLFLLKGAEFGGSDDAGSQLVDVISGPEGEPWFEPILETILGGELPGEIETTFFCIQTGIGVGIIAYCFGFLVARKKFSAKKEV